MSETPVWSNITSSAGPSPPPRISGGMVYDAADGYTLLFGGEYLNTSSFRTTYYNDTWAFENGTWRNLSIAFAPSPRFGFGLAYDVEDGYVVLFGGSSKTASYLSDTWTYSGGVWTNITKATAPPARFWASMTYDEPDGFVVLFGGLSTGSSYVGDTWKFVGGDWSQLSAPTHPSARDGSAIASFNPVQNDVILFGGLNATAYLNDSWSFVDGSWTLLSPSTPPDPRTGAGFVMDTAQKLGVLFGGYPANDYPYGTWIDDDGSWTDYSLAVTPPDGTVWDQMCYDPADQWVVLYASSLPYTWVLNFTNGSPPFEVSASVTPQTGDAPLPVTFSSTVSGGTPPYEFSWTTGDGATFHTQNASFTYTTAGTYDVHVWVNDSAAGAFVDSWTVTVASTGSFEADGSSTPNPAHTGETVWFNSTASGGTPPYSFAWTFGDGGSSPVQDATHAYAAAGVYDVSFEGSDSNAGVIWVNSTETVTAAPLTVVADATPLSGPAPLPVAFTSTPSGGTGPYTYQWQFGDLSATSTSENASYTYNIVGSYKANLTVTDSLGAHVSDTWTIDAQPPPLGVTITASTVTPSVGENVSFMSIAFGGSAPYSYAWTFGDQATATTPDPGHSYEAAGTFPVTLTVQDKHGNTSSANLTIVVSAGSQTTSASIGLWEIAIVVVLVLAVILFLILGRRRKKEPPTPTGSPDGAPAPPPSP
jgi:PKD repeat protein